MEYVDSMAKINSYGVLDREREQLRRSTQLR
jgi:hypothetical protein